MRDIKLKDFLRYFGRHYIVALAVIMILMVIGVVVYDVAIRTVTYQAEVKVMVTKNSSNKTITTNDIVANQKLANSYAEVVRSDLVLEQVIEELNLKMSVEELDKDLTMGIVDNTSVLKITVKSFDAESAVKIAEEIAKVSSKEFADIYKSDNLTQINSSVISDASTASILKRDIILVVVVVTFGMVGLAFVRFYFDKKIRLTDDTEQLFGLPVVGVISGTSDNKKKGGQAEDIYTYAMNEGIRELRAGVQANIDEKTKVVLVTSVNAGEGKSFVATNLAISLARTGKKTLLIDCDSQNSSDYFGVGNDGVGLIELLRSNLQHVDKYILPTKLEGLSVIHHGVLAADLNDLLVSAQGEKMMKKLRSMYDAIMLDGMAMNSASDVLALGKLADEALLVIKDASTNIDDILATKTRLSRVKINIIGVVFNTIDE